MTKISGIYFKNFVNFRLSCGVCVGWKFWSPVLLVCSLAQTKIDYPVYFKSTLNIQLICLQKLREGILDFHRDLSSKILKYQESNNRGKIKNFSLYRLRLSQLEFGNKSNLFQVQFYTHYFIKFECYGCWAESTRFTEWKLLGFHGGKIECAVDCTQDSTRNFLIV